jgi:hypothetical protein
MEAKILDFLAGLLVDHEHPGSEIQEALGRLPKVGE